MSVVPSGTSTTCYLYPGCYVVDPNNILQPNVAITVKDSAGATLLPRGSVSPYSLLTLASSAGGFVPPVYLASDGGPVLYSAATIVPVSVACDEGVTPGQFASHTARLGTLETALPPAPATLAASATTAGVVRLATTIEAAAGTDPTIAVTPVALAVKQDAFREYSTLAAATAGLAAGDFADGAYVVVTG